MRLTLTQNVWLRPRRLHAGCRRSSHTDSLQQEHVAYQVVGCHRREYLGARRLGASNQEAQVWVLRKPNRGSGAWGYGC